MYILYRNHACFHLAVKCIIPIGVRIYEANIARHFTRVEKCASCDQRCVKTNDVYNLPAMGLSGQTKKANRQLLNS